MREMYRRRNWNWIFILSCFGLLLVANVEAQLSRLPAIAIGGTEYVRVSDVARYYGMSASVSGKTVTVVHQPSNNRLQIEIDDREAWLNGTKVWFNSPPIVARGMTLIGRL